MISEDEITDRIRQMMMRPRMWAQSVGSFEDQIVLLLDLLDGDLRNNYLYFCSQAGCKNGPLSTNYTTFRSMQIKLKEFIDTKVDAEILAESFIDNLG